MGRLPKCDGYSQSRSEWEDYIGAPENGRVLRTFTGYDQKPWIILVGQPGIEPGTIALKGRCSTS